MAMVMMMFLSMLMPAYRAARGLSPMIFTS